MTVTTSLKFALTYKEAQHIIQNTIVFLHFNRELNFKSHI